MKLLSLTSEVFEVPAPHALGALFVVGGLTKADFPGVALAALLFTYLLYVAARQIIVFRSELDGSPSRTPELDSDAHTLA
jgi:hypothetical protein